MSARLPRYLYIEPFHRGSHASFTEAITDGVKADWTVLTLPGRHWKWRMRGAAVWFATEEAAQLEGPFDAVLASAYLDLPALKALAPAVAAAPTALYFHENQLEYPMRPEWSGERDLHYGFTQLVSALAAEACWFNSEWNLDSFVDAARRLLGRMPDHVPRGWPDAIQDKARVLPVPLDLPEIQLERHTDDRASGPVLLWNHRWEHDKDPEAFVRVLQALAARNVPFRIAICGAGRPELPEVLSTRIIHLGRVEERQAYWALLARCHIVVSTAIHEFFGVSVLEAVHAGARPLVPDRLAYRETLPAEYRHATEEDLLEQLETLCRGWATGEIPLRRDRAELVDRYRCDSVVPMYAAAMAELAAR